MLRAQLARGVARHAYLFTGPAGVGRRTLALRFAQALNCPQPPAPGEPCGECRDCRGFAAGAHPDLSVVAAERAGGTLRVDQVREVRRLLALKPYQAAFRVALFLRFEEANENAANALLKTLEEAPAHAVLLLTAEAAEALLPTIPSRCEVLRLRPLSLDDLEAVLRARGANEHQARTLAHLAGGRPGCALSLLAEPEALALRAARLDELQALLGATRVERFKYAEQLAQDREALRETLQVWSSFWRDVLLRAGGARAPLANPDREPSIAALSGRLGLARARQALASLETAGRRLERNVNARLLAEVLLLDLPGDQATTSKGADQ